MLHLVFEVAGTQCFEREYVINRNASTGGIQRFKAGHHGASHTFAAMIAYVQEETVAVWHGRVASWIEKLNATNHHGWFMKDLMFLEPESVRAGLTVYHSSHTREKGCPILSYVICGKRCTERCKPGLSNRALKNGYAS